MSSPGTLPFLKMPLTVFEVAIAARDRLPDWLGGAVEVDECDVTVVIVGARGSSKTTDVRFPKPKLFEGSGFPLFPVWDARDVLESVLFDCRPYLRVPIDMDDFFSSILTPPLPCLLLLPLPPSSVVAETCRPPSCRAPLDVEELPADDGVLYGGGDNDGKLRSSPGM